MIKAHPGNDNGRPIRPSRTPAKQRLKAPVKLVIRWTYHGGYRSSRDHQDGHCAAPPRHPGTVPYRNP